MIILASWQNTKQSLIGVGRLNLEDSEANKQIMKRYGNLYSQVYNMENIREAHKNARKGKVHYREVKMVDANQEAYFEQIHNMLRDKTFHNSNYKVFQLFDGRKTREIYKLPYFPDRIIHHCIMQVIEPIWIKTLIPNTFACIKGRGIHKGMEKLKESLKDKQNTRYCLKGDVSKFYPSIDHDILKGIIRYKIKDPDLLWLLDEIIDSAPGIPIGNYLSQHFGNLYLSTLDHKIKEEFNCKYYFRYCDDFVVLHSDKSFLHELLEKVKGILDILKLKLKANWQIFPVAIRGIDFLGYRFFPDYTLLRKSTATIFKRKMRWLKHNHNWERLEPIQTLSIVMSYYGWLKHANCLNLTRHYIDTDIRNIVSIVCKRQGLHNPLLEA